MDLVAVEELIAAIKAGNSVAVRRELDSDHALVHFRAPGAASPILTAIYHGHPELIPLFLASGAELTLHEAAASGARERVLEVLLKEPNRLDETGEDGHAPLGLAIFFGHQELARELIHKGADVNLASKNEQNVAPLHAAVSRGEIGIVELLLARGADPNSRQQQGFTPLFAAAFQGREDIARLLLENGADSAALTDEGKSASMIAEERGHAELAMWLASTTA